MEEEGTGLKHRDSVSGTTPGSPTREPAREAQIREGTAKNPRQGCQRTFEGSKARRSDPT